MSQAKTGTSTDAIVDRAATLLRKSPRFAPQLVRAMDELEAATDIVEQIVKIVKSFEALMSDLEHDYFVTLEGGYCFQGVKIKIKHSLETRVLYCDAVKAVERQLDAICQECNTLLPKFRATPKKERAEFDEREPGPLPMIYRGILLSRIGQRTGILLV